jgi:FixJ family two-component response regulator
LPTLLIVDDDGAVLDALSEAVRLRLADVHVETSDSAADALSRISREDFDVIVTDIKMPAMDGLELLARIRRVRPATPTLLITGHGEQDLAIRALRQGAHDYILKPIDRDYFVQSLRHALEVRGRARRVDRERQRLEDRGRRLRQRLERRTRELRILYDRESAARAALDNANRELQQAQRRRQELVTMVAHDLGVPLAALRAYVEAEATRASPSGQDLARSTIISETKRMERLVKDLAQAATVSGAEFALEPTPTDLAAIARQQVALAQTRSDRHSISIEAPDSLVLACDPDRMAQVFANLLSNALRTRGGAIVVRLWSEGANACASIEVAGGRGRARSDLGLTIARAIVEAHGGRLQSPRGAEGLRLSVPSSRST